MGNFNEIVPRRLNILPAREATLSEAQNAPVPFDKYYTLKPTRIIEHLKSYFILPATRMVPSSEYLYFGRLLFQYNVTASQPFFVLTPPQILETFPCILTIKWRKGTTVYRYFLLGEQVQYTRYAGTPPPPVGTIIGVNNIAAFPIYTNQEIPVNCVFEVWSDPYLTFNINTPCGMQNDLKLEVSMRPNPSTPDDIEQDIIVGPAIDVVAGQYVNFPLAIPIVNNPWPSVVWNDNP